MKTKRNLILIWLLWAMLLAHPAVVTALTITDNFTNPTNWGTPFTTPGANISIGGGRMNYTASTTNEGLAAIPRNGPPLPTTQDWSIKVDVHVDPFTLITNGHFIDVFLGFGKTGDWFDNYVIFEFDRGWWSAGPGYDIGDDVRIDGVEAPDLFTVLNLSSPDASLRMDYTAANHTITYYFDANGPTGGYNWVVPGTANLASGTYNLNLSLTDTFTIIVSGSSELQTVATGQAYLSNLEISMNAIMTGHVYCTCDGSPITNALVQITNASLGGFSSTTDSAGSYSITNLQEGTYAAVVTAANHEPLTNSVIVPSTVAGVTNDFSLTNKTLVIRPDFDSTITSNTNAAIITNAIQSAIGIYRYTIADPFCLPIHFSTTNYPGIFGASVAANISIEFAQFLADLQANPRKSASDSTALPTMPPGPNTGINGDAHLMFLTSANLLAIGEAQRAGQAVAAANNGGYHGIVLLNVYPPDQSAKLARLRAVTTHEVNEVLGIGGYGSTVGVEPDAIGPLDLFRYSSNGVRSFTTNTSAKAYFSIDGGNSMLVYFNQSGDGSSHGDWGNGIGPTNDPPQLQDARGTGDPSMGPNEYIALDIVGYTLLAPPSAIQSAAFAGNSFSFGMTTWPGFLYQVQFTANLTSGTWDNSGAPITATNVSAVISATNANTPKGFYRVITFPPRGSP